MTGITAIGAYLPRARLSRAAIADAMGWLTPGLPRKGSRTLGFWDEDATTMGVAVARTCLAQPGQVHAPASLDFCTLTPPFAERQNASILHAALRLPVTCSTQESGTTARASLIALHRQLVSDAPGLVIAADRPVTSPGSAAEGRMGDGGAAIAVNTGPELLSYLGGGSLTSAMTERYRAPGAPFATEWEDRWVREEGWQTLAVAAIEAALREANLAADAVDHLVLATTQPRLAGLVARTAGLNKARLADDLGAGIGDTASAQGLMMLAAAVGTIRPGETVLLAGLGQGATALLFRATEDIKQARTGFSESRDAGLSETNYTKLLFFNGLLSWDPGQRGKTSVMEALTTAHRYSDALLSFTGGRCRETGAVQFPPSRISANAQAALLDTQEPWPLADLGGRVASRTADTLAFSRTPPSCYGLVDFHGGGRLMMDFTDPDAPSIAIGDPVEFVFRVKDIDETTGFRRYFWKAVRAASADQTKGKEHADAERA